MKLLGMILLLHTLAVYAQDECEFKLYVDSLHGFSLKIPKQQKIIDNEGATYRYKAVELNKRKYNFDVKQKKQFSNYWLGYTDVLISLKDLNAYVDVNRNDTLLTIATFRCREKYIHRLTGTLSYFRIDSLFQWTKNNDIRIIEYHRTQVDRLQDGSEFTENVGPRFFLHIITLKGDFVLDFDFYNYILKDDYNIAKKIASSIKIIK
jgi:hypothetical protein